MMVTYGRVVSSARHSGMPHCESSLLLELSNLPDFFENVSRDHVIVSYGDHVREFAILAQVLGLEFSAYGNLPFRRQARIAESKHAC